MKVHFNHFSAAAVERERYQEGVDYLSQEFDLEFEDTLYLLTSLKNRRCTLSVKAPHSSLYFYVADDSSLRVEIDDFESGLWADTEVDLGIATEILRMASVGQSFGETIPTTEREWDAYSIL
jgi:hypothetical protein